MADGKPFFAALVHCEEDGSLAHDSREAVRLLKAAQEQFSNSDKLVPAKVPSPEVAAKSVAEVADICPRHTAVAIFTNDSDTYHATLGALNLHGEVYTFTVVKDGACIRRYGVQARS
ncbi:MAG: hypothetical protein LBR05_06145 [Azoarcus sp.]|nr:hypothetical protein [Azoarcus sp.]